MRHPTRRVVLICEECGEKLLLSEPEEVWLSTGTRFECECGEDVTLGPAAWRGPYQKSTARDNNSSARPREG